MVALNLFLRDPRQNFNKALLFRVDAINVLRGILTGSQACDYNAVVVTILQLMGIDVCSLLWGRVESHEMPFSSDPLDAHSLP